MEQESGLPLRLAGKAQKCRWEPGPAAAAAAAGLPSCLAGARLRQHCAVLLEWAVAKGAAAGPKPEQNQPFRLNTPCGGAAVADVGVTPRIV
jgi:hypothetical protein